MASSPLNFTSRLVAVKLYHKRFAARKILSNVARSLKPYWRSFASYAYFGKLYLPLNLIGAVFIAR